MTLEPLPPGVCPDCGETLHAIEWAQPALLRHGGYGATESHAIRACACGWRLPADISTTRP